MIKSNVSFLGIFIILLISCNSILPNNTPMYCGYELSAAEYQLLRTKSKSQKSTYEADSLWNIYDQINDSIRAVMPDSVEFEIFLSLLNDDEVGIDIFVPRNKAYFEKIGCALMNSNYKGKAPEQIFMCLYTYTNPDGSGDIPLEIATKKKK